MTDLRQAAMLALEAWDDPMGMKDLCVAMDALRKALAQPEQQAEPCIGKDSRCPCQDGDACHYKDCGSTKALPAAQPEQEPVAKLFGTLPVFDTPPAAQCTWVGLTDEDWDHIDNTNGTSQDTFIQGAAWAAARLKERNNG